MHGFVVRLNAAGTAIEYASYMGGSNTSNVTGLAVDQLSRVYIAGTASPRILSWMAVSWRK